MNSIIVSGNVRKKNHVKRTVKDKDCLTFVLENMEDKKKSNFLCVVYDRLVRRVDKAVDIGDKVLVQGILKEGRGPKNQMVIEVVQLELLDFIRYEDKTRNDRGRTKQQVIQERLKRIGR